MLLLQVPESYLPERSYIINLIFEYFWDLPVHIEPWSFKYTRLSVANDKTDHELILEDGLFSCTEANWLKENSLPALPLAQWDTSKTPIMASLVESVQPVLFGICRQGQYIDVSDGRIWLGLDILGAAFFMLSRYEEYLKSDRDQHNRFPAALSLASRAGFLHRPLINEYLEILWWCLKKLWPGLQRRQRMERIFLSHDVDIPYEFAFKSNGAVIRSLGGDLIKRKSPALMIKNFYYWRAEKRKGIICDPNNTYDYLMDMSEEKGLKSAFYFKAGCTHEEFDYDYSLDHPEMRSLIRNIGNRGHEVGLHPSYETYLDQEQTKAEFDRLLQVCAEEGIKQDKWGGRQHFLRWQVPTTWCNWAEIGLSYDSSLSYADKAGFRCGICYEYPVYDLKQRKMLKLLERPLLVMEGSLIEDEYMGLKTSDALVFMQNILKRSRMFNGDFTLLWHNHSLQTPEMRNLYSELLKSL